MCRRSRLSLLVSQAGHSEVSLEAERAGRSVIKSGQDTEAIRLPSNLQEDLLRYTAIEANFNLLVQQAYEYQLETEQLSVEWG